jgi:hypothetical protein
MSYRKDARRSFWKRLDKSLEGQAPSRDARAHAVLLLTTGKAIPHFTIAALFAVGITSLRYGYVDLPHFVVRSFVRFGTSLLFQYLFLSVAFLSVYEVHRSALFRNAPPSPAQIGVATRKFKSCHIEFGGWWHIFSRALFIAIVGAVAAVTGLFISISGWFGDDAIPALQRYLLGIIG